MVNEKKIICFDIDNIICKTVKNNYKNSKPNKKIIKLINSLFEKGYTIKTNFSKLCSFHHYCVCCYTIIILPILFTVARCTYYISPLPFLCSLFVLLAC